MKVPVSLERLITEFSRLPSIGKKTAQRLAFSILRYSPEEAMNLAVAIQQVKQQVHHCSICFGFTESDPCLICADLSRQQNSICVVEQPHNIFLIERSGIFQGYYHVLMGAFSPLDGIGPEQLKIKELKTRITENPIHELILATNPTIQGEVTASFLRDKFAVHVEKITRLARGLPAGGDLEYVDDITLQEAFSGRHTLS